MPVKTKITISQARRIALETSLLYGKTKLPKGKDRVRAVIQNLGYIQIDTISVIERAHHHTLWTRCPDFKPEYLHELLAKDRAIFEYWGHAMSYLPIEDYRFYKHAFKRFKEPSDKWNRMRLEKTKAILPGIIKRIKNEGPLSSKDFESSGSKKSNGWWDWKPAKIALELLYWQGILMVTERKNFHRYYDLTKRVLPDSIDKTNPTLQKRAQFWITRALNSYGIATLSEIKKHIHQVDKKAIEKQLAKLISTSEVLEIKIAGLSDPYYMLAKQFDNFCSIKKKKAKLHILSPFDNFIIQRERIKRLFSFEYSLECYLPAPKRTFGYFVLPIIYGEHIVARADMKADRKTKTLIIHNIYLEKDFQSSSEFLKAFAAKLNVFLIWQGCTSIQIKNTYPSSLKNQLKKIF